MTAWAVVRSPSVCYGPRDMRTLTFIRTLGSGAFGTVYLAEFSSGQGFRRQVAVKVLLRSQADNEMFLSRIRDEARLLGLLQDDSILKVLDMVQIEGMDAVVMEYVEGVDLDTLAREGEPPPPRALAELAASVSGALSRAHTAMHPTSRQALNVVHRDVKPANIMVTSSGGVKLLDFGVARARFDARESQTGQFMLGTLNYMAPEYIVTGEVSPAADIFGLALAVWEVAAGEGFGQPKIRQDAHERRVAERLEKLRSQHGELLPILERMLQWNPVDRPTGGEAERAFLMAADNLRGMGLRTWASTQVAKVIQTRTLAPDSASLLGKTVPLSQPAGEASLGGLSSGQTLVPESGPVKAPPPLALKGLQAPPPPPAQPPPVQAPQHTPAAQPQATPIGQPRQAPSNRATPVAPSTPPVPQRTAPPAPTPPARPPQEARQPPSQQPTPPPLRAQGGDRATGPVAPVRRPPPPSRTSEIVKGLLIGGVLGFVVLMAGIAFLLLR